MTTQRKYPKSKSPILCFASQYTLFSMVNKGDLKIWKLSGSWERSYSYWFCNFKKELKEFKKEIKEL